MGSLSGVQVQKIHQTTKTNSIQDQRECRTLGMGCIIINKKRCTDVASRPLLQDFHTEMFMCVDRFIGRSIKYI